FWKESEVFIRNITIIKLYNVFRKNDQFPKYSTLDFEDFMLKPIDLNLLLSKIGDKLGLVWIDSKSETLLENNEVQ
ncbi:hypothetical protein RFX40_05250, partial [Acinetobacter baumannii]|nr:hypothetical protein [Acinetobacter baumannii]